MTFNFGISLTTSFGDSVDTMVVQALPWTLGLVGVTTLVAFILGTFIGLISAWRRGRLARQCPAAHLRMTSAFPYFWMALLFITFFHNARVFPSEHAYNIFSDSPGLELALRR